MKNLTALLLVPPVFMAVASSTSAQSIDLLKKDVENIRVNWEAALNERTSAAAAAHALAAMFTADGVLNVAGGVQVGPAAIEKFYVSGIEAGNPTDIHVAVTDLQASGKMGWGYGTTVEKLGGKPTDLYWGAVYEFADGHYKIKVLTGAIKPPPAPAK